jgi:phosphate transport system substrate-binding protein
MVINTLEIKKNIIHSILDFSVNIDSFKKSGLYSLNQISEMLSLAIEINNLINFLDKDGSKYSPPLIKPNLPVVELTKMKRALELSLKYKSDINSIAIDIGENLSSTNRYLQKGIDYIFDNIKNRDFKMSIAPNPAPQPSPIRQSTVSPRKSAQPKKQSVGFMAPLMFFIALGVAGMVVYNSFFDRSATKTVSLVKEYRSDRKLSSIDRPDQSSELKIYGTKAILNVFEDLQTAFKSGNPKIPFSIEGGDSGIAIRDLIDGRISLAASSRIPTVIERKKAIQAGKPLSDHKIALDSVVVFVHTSNPISVLSVEDLKKIYSKSDLSWKDLQKENSSDQKIARFSLSKESGTYAFFMDRVMYSEPTSDGVIHIYTPDKMIDLVASNPYAIGVASLSALMNRKDVKVLKISSVFNETGTKPLTDSGSMDSTLIQRGEYPLTRYLYLISAGELTDSQAKFIDFMRSPQAQAKLVDYGLVGVL